MMTRQRLLDGLTVLILGAVCWRLVATGLEGQGGVTTRNWADLAGGDAAGPVWDSLVRLSSPLSAGEKEVELLMVSDFDCEFCRRSVPAVDSVIQSGVQVHYLHLTRGRGSVSDHAARVSICAQEHGIAFATIYRRLMRSDDWRRLPQLNLEELVPGHVEEVERCASSARVDAILEESGRLARDLGVRGTPTFCRTREWCTGRPPLGRSLRYSPFERVQRPVDP